MFIARYLSHGSDQCAALRRPPQLGLPELVTTCISNETFGSKMVMIAAVEKCEHCLPDRTATLVTVETWWTFIGDVKGPWINPKELWCAPSSSACGNNSSVFFPRILWDWLKRLIVAACQPFLHSRFDCVSGFGIQWKLIARAQCAVCRVARWRARNGNSLWWTSDARFGINQNATNDDNHILNAVTRETEYEWSAFHFKLGMLMPAYLFSLLGDGSTQFKRAVSTHFSK